MILQPKTLRVYPNPWGVNPSVVLSDGPVDDSTLDPEGRPCGVVLADGVGDGGSAGRFVGARVCAVHTKVGPTPKSRMAVLVGDIWKPRQTTVYSFLGCTAHETKPYQLAEELAKRDPIALPYTEYYRVELANGSLIAADERTAKAGGQTFEDPKTLFPKLARAAAKIFDVQRFEGGDAYEQFVSERADEAAANEPSKPNAAPAAAAKFDQDAKRASVTPESAKESA